MKVTPERERARVARGYAFSGLTRAEELAVERWIKTGEVTTECTLEYDRRWKASKGEEVKTDAAP